MRYSFVEDAALGAVDSAKVNDELKRLNEYYKAQGLDFGVPSRRVSVSASHLLPRPYQLPKKRSIEVAT